MADGIKGKEYDGAEVTTPSLFEEPMRSDLLISFYYKKVALTMAVLITITAHALLWCG
jgi:hypothetical protein